MIMKNSEFDNNYECGRHKKSCYGYGYNTDPLGYGCNRSSRDNDSAGRCGSHGSKCYGAKSCHDMSSMSNAKSWFDAWSPQSGTSRRSMVDDIFSLNGAGDLLGKGLNYMPSLFGGKSVSNSMRSLWKFDDSMMVTENDKEYLITLAVPGCEGRDVSVNVRDYDGRQSYLDISWRYSRQSKSDDHRSVWMGKAWGSGSRSLPIPEDCNKDAIRADIKNGSLVIMMPKARSRGGKSINIL